ASPAASRSVLATSDRVEHAGRRDHVQRFAVALVDVHTTGQARVEAAHRAHDVDALEVLVAALLEDRGVLHGVLVRAGGAVAVAHAAVPGCGRVRVVVRDLAAADDHVVGEHAAHGLGEADADGLVGHRELLPGLRVARAHLGERLLDEVQRARGRVGLEVGAGAVALDRVGQRGALLVDRALPLVAGFRLEDRPRQVDLHGAAGRLDEADVDEPG